MRRSVRQAPNAASTRPPHRTAARRAVIWPTYHVVSVPAIMGAPGAIAIVPWIFMQVIVSRERAHMPRRVQMQLREGGRSVRS
jgi:hypothetical protein